MGPFVFHSEKQIFVLRSQNWTWTPRLIPNGPEGLLELESGAKIGYFPKCIPNTEAIFRSLEQEVEWQRRSIILYGRGVMQPRLIAYMADHPSLSFTYSRSTLFPSEYTPTVAAIKTQLEAFLQSTFNCVLLNFYRDGKDNVGWHSDDEHLFGPDPFIASVSFGERRAFDLRSNHDSKIRIRYLLGQGDVLTMDGGAAQQNWKHAIPPSKKIEKGRINLTFRKIIFPETNKQRLL